MPSAIGALQKALFEILSGDASVVAILGGARVYDRAPRKAAYPYLTFGRAAMRDWSTATEEGAEHTVTLHAWSQDGGRLANAEILAIVKSVLEASALSIAGQNLVNLQHEFSEIRQDADGETWRGLLRFRAVTEPVV